MNTLSVLTHSLRVSPLCLSLLGSWGLVSNQGFAQPRIDTISAARGRIRDNLVLQGANFSPNPGNNVVMLGGVRAPVFSATGGSLAVKVPGGVPYGPVSVTVDGLTGWSSWFFSAALPTVGNWDNTAFGGPVELTVGGGQEMVAAGDLDGDGRVDVVSPNRDSGMISIFQGIGEAGVLGANSFAARIDLPTGGTPMAVALGDMDGDGKLDIVVANREGLISVFRNIGSAGPMNVNSFAPRVDFASSDGDLRTLALGDLDGDGRLDMVAGSGNWRMMVFRNLGGEGSVSFARSFELSAMGQVVALALGDLDGDHKLDIVACGFDGYKASIYRNVGAAGALSAFSFDSRYDLSLGFYPAGIALADLNGDNRLDLVAINYAGGDIYVYQNVGSPASPTAGLFGARVEFPAAVGCFTVAIGDINGDGKPDISVANNLQNSISVFLNTGTNATITTASLAARRDFPASSGPRAVLLADVDGDGKLDLVVARQGTTKLSILHNNLEPMPDPPVITQQPSSQTVQAEATVSLNVVATGAEPLSYQWRLNGTNLPGAVGQSLVIVGAKPAQSGIYSAVVSNPSGSTLSSDATVLVNTAPVARSQSVSVNEDNPLLIILNASDADNDGLTYSVGVPAHGKLVGVPPSLTYVPDPNYNGTDAFAFQVSDGRVASEIATVSITVAPVNDPPVAFAQPVTVDEDTAVSITLTGADVDGDALTFVVSQPQHGSVTGVSPNFTYLPEPNFYGSDSFTFVAQDGIASSPSASVSITVRPVNDPPLAFSQAVTLDEDSSVAITLAGSDVDGDTLTFVVTQPQHGTLAGVPPILVYKPESNYFGSDSFTFVAQDGAASSESASVSITVTPVNDPPVAFSQAVTVDEDTSVAITLTGADPDGDPLTFVLTQPQHGTLTGVAPNLTYKPASNFFGADSFTFAVQDGLVASESVTVNVTVLPVDDAPIAKFVVGPLYSLPSSPGRLAILALNNLSASVDLDGSASTDVESDPLQFTWSESGSKSFGSSAKVTQVFGTGFHTLTLAVNDGKLSEATTLTFEVVPPSAVVNTMRSLVDGANMGKKFSLYESLNAAATSLDKGNVTAALGQLGALQNKLQAQMAPTDPKCAALLNEAIQTLLNELTRQ
jgi:hypothetical protein